MQAGDTRKLVPNTNAKSHLLDCSFAFVICSTGNSQPNPTPVPCSLPQQFAVALHFLDASLKVNEYLLQRLHLPLNLFPCNSANWLCLVPARKCKQSKLVETTYFK